jgi:hypothetical protein
MEISSVSKPPKRSVVSTMYSSHFNFLVKHITMYMSIYSSRPCIRHTGTNYTRNNNASKLPVKVGFQDKPHDILS